MITISNRWMKRGANREAKNALDCDKLKFLSPSEVFIIVFKNGMHVLETWGVFSSVNHIL